MKDKKLKINQSYDFLIKELRKLFTILMILCALSATAQKTSQIKILNANTLEFDETTGVKAKKLIGNVELQHENALMYCDSAYVFSTSNTLEAYSNVRIVQGDSLQLFGDSLKYNGNTKIALLRGNIRLLNNDVELTTKYLDFDRNKNIAYYFNGGTMISHNKQDTLTAKKGYYFTKKQSFFFKGNVILKDPKYTIVSDTLNFNDKSEIVNFLGPTTITSKTNFIYTENGWYNTKKNISQFYKNAYLYADKKIIKGDTLYYDRANGLGIITCNASITDTAANIIIKGDMVHLYEKKDSAIITNQALLMQLFKNDTLYLHADTFTVSSQFVKKKIVLKDTLLTTKKDSVYTDTLRTLFAYHHAKFYKKDMQGKADSVIYSFSDSTVKFYNDPIIWSKENQLTATFIYLLMKKGDIHAIYLKNKAFIISKADSLLANYNQIKGKNMVGYFKDKKLNKIIVKEHTETIYYARDDDGKYIGVNKAHGNNMLIFLDSTNIKSITFIKDPTGTLYPLHEPSPKDLILKGFNWRIDEKPKNFFDIFIH